MAKKDYRDVASEIVERYFIAEEREPAPFSCEDYSDGYRDAIRMVLNVLCDKEITETKNFYKFSKVFEE